MDIEIVEIDIKEEQFHIPFHQRYREFHLTINGTTLKQAVPRLICKQLGNNLETILLKNFMNEMNPIIKDVHSITEKPLTKDELKWILK